eukprot:scaffold404807_cov83-Attheya_sp.AAC.1
MHYVDNQPSISKQVTRLIVANRAIPEAAGNIREKHPREGDNIRERERPESKKDVVATASVSGATTIKLLPPSSSSLVVLVGFEGLYRFDLLSNGRPSATVGFGGVCVVESWTVVGMAWFVTDGAGLKRVTRVGTRLVTAVAKVVGFEGLY